MENQLESLIPLFKMINDKMEKKINSELKEYDITFSQVRVLVLLYGSRKNDYAMKDLERIFHVSQQTIAGIINRLEHKKRVVSYLDPSDKRVKRVKLTESGKELGGKTYQMMKQSEEWIENSLVPKEQETLIILLQKVYSYMELS